MGQRARINSFAEALMVHRAWGCYPSFPREAWDSKRDPRENVQECLTNSEQCVHVESQGKRGEIGLLATDLLDKSINMVKPMTKTDP